jgi:hypothetical protein
MGPGGVHLCRLNGCGLTEWHALFHASPLTDVESRGQEKESSCYRRAEQCFELGDVARGEDAQNQAVGCNAGAVVPGGLGGFVGAGTGRQGFACQWRGRWGRFPVLRLEIQRVRSKG